MLSNPGHNLISQLRRQPVFSFYLSIFLLTLLGTALIFIFHGNIVVQWIVAGSPMFVAVLLTVLLDGRTGIQRLLAHLVHWKVPFYWYLIVLSLPVLYSLVWIFLDALSSGTGLQAGLGSIFVWLRAITHNGPAILVMVLTMAFMEIGEEIGWRGFALDRLLKYQNPLVASVIVGFFWGIWHLPSVLDPTSVLNKAPLPYSLSLFTLGTIVFSFVFTWLWQKTGGSLPVICLFHGAYDLLNYFTATLFHQFYVQFWLYLIALAIITIPLMALSKPLHWITRLGNVSN